MANPSQPPAMGIENEENIEQPLEKPKPAMVEVTAGEQIVKSGEELGKALDKTKSFEDYVGQSEKVSKLFGSKEALNKFTGEIGMDEQQRDLIKQYGITSQEMYKFMDENNMSRDTWDSMSFVDRDKVVKGIIAQKEMVAASTPGYVEVKEEKEEAAIPEDFTKSEAVQGESELVHPLTGQVIGNATLDSIPVDTTWKTDEIAPSQPVVAGTPEQEQTLAQLNMKNAHGVEEWSQNPDGSYYVRLEDRGEIIPAEEFEARYGRTLSDSAEGKIRYETTY